MKAINDHFPHWFNARFKEFNDAPERLPFDQHCLVALCAPRPVLLSNAEGDEWSNPPGQFEERRQVLAGVMASARNMFWQHAPARPGQ